MKLKNIYKIARLFFLKETGFFAEEEEKVKMSKKKRKTITKIFLKIIWLEPI